MNNKGFAITSIIYGLMLLFIVTISSFLSILVGRNRRMDELITGVYETLEYEEITVTLADFDLEKKVYVTPKRGMYYFPDSDCNIFLPKSVVLITGATKLSGDESVKNKLYYNVNGNENVEDYKELKCIQ